MKSICNQLNHVFYPHSVAMIGASTNFKRLGYHCMKSLIMSHFQGEIYPVHPSLSEISGFKAYPSIKAIPSEVVLTDENIDGLVLYAAYASANRPLLKEITGLLKSHAYGKSKISCFPSPTGVWVEEKEEFEQSGVAIYPTPERAAKALVGLVKRAYILARADDLRFFPPLPCCEACCKLLE